MDDFEFSGITLNDVISPLLVLQTYTVMINELPIKSGNLRHNAAGLIVSDMTFAMEIDKTEAIYFDDVYGYYKDLGDDFMERGTVAAYNFLELALQGNNALNDPKYLEARKSVLSTARNTEEREITNVLYGSGKYGGITGRRLEQIEIDRYKGLTR
ncbi:hypothetical protein DRO61_00880 [Candidatus Bathyarchaeota archaeon]|nr:MAG: hypothetical protein DRO61_00880 [Candidatus Bathyarchaeota archaeon]